MLEEICILFITISTCSLGFNLSCPGSGQWTFRAMVYCSDLNMYTCLLDTTKSRYTETCDGDRKEIDGQKTTINRNNFDAAKCKLDRFQPMDFTTVGNSDCVFQKSKCEQEGQIAGHEIKEKTSVLDTNCLCDYTKGYSFINIPRDKCYCSPSVDDCSCFREFCPSGKILSPDYQCTTQIDMKNRKWNCSKIASADKSQNGDQVQQSIDPKNERRSRMAVQVIVPILVLIMAGLLIWCWKTSKLDKIKERIICLVCKKGDDNESEKMTIETQHSPEKNDKIKHKLPDKDNANESEEIIIPTEITLASDKNDKIQYEAYEKDDDDKSEAINLSTEILHSPDKNDEIQHELSRQRDSKTSVHDLSSSQEDLKYNQIDGRKTDSSSSEDDEKLSFKSTQSSITGLNESEDKNRVTNNSKDTTKDSGDITKESDEENCMVEVEENKIKKIEELRTFAKDQKDKHDVPVDETCNVMAEFEKTSAQDNTDDSDGLDAKKSEIDNKKRYESSSQIQAKTQQQHENSVFPFSSFRMDITMMQYQWFHSA
ncbi:uncharacterized protein LOC134705771 [Mytilus trossulus]|uniref:uncharacterized protein LOC134705771 n=1 Tax=Mytilus trossulus TaxID=6551 RepID=UPI0030076A54